MTNVALSKKTHLRGHAHEDGLGKISTFTLS
jgi:hypothetical protein